ncbi:MAG: hypothetical protein J6Y74_05035 [Clostridia bacterium]|nr:hypothetical protein [Clostridia bacterium]
MIATSVIVIVTFVLLTSSILFLPSLKAGKRRVATYWIVALAGAVLLLSLRLVPLREVGEALVADDSINPLKILILFFSMTFLSVVLDEVGFFRYLANKAVRLAGRKQFSLFTTFYFLTAILTVFTSNDVVILTLTPFICFFCKNAKADPLPYLVGEFAAANTWSMMLVIGNPTNVYLATSAGIDFLGYLRVMALPTLVSGALEFALIALLFGRRLKAELSPEEERVEITSKPDLIVGLIHLGVCLLFLVLSGYLHIEMWLVSAVCAGSLLLSLLVIRLVMRSGWRTLGDSFARLPWQLIPFVLSMFVIVIAIRYQGISAKLGAFLGEKQVVWTYGVSSFFAANLINNIPMSILFSTLPTALSEAAKTQAIFASVVGSNVGAFLTPIGALAGIMFTDLTARYEVKYGFKEFITYGAMISLPTLAAALFVLRLVL